jgi:thymidylate kinase
MTENVSPQNVPSASSAQETPITAIKVILDGMEANGIRYCHWKSNYHIDYAVTAREDVDVLIKEDDFPLFIKLMAENGYRQADSVTNREQPGVFHFLGSDDATGVLINFHTYTRILTGDHFMKSWALPFERMLLAETERVGVIHLPPKSTEIIIYTVRNMIKHTTLFDLYLYKKATKLTLEEYVWLTDGLDMDAVLAKLAKYFPEISPEDFKAAMDLVGSNGSFIKRVRLGFKFRNALSKYRRYSQLDQSVRSVLSAFEMAISKFGRKEKHMHFLTGGKIIALVGPQATGKSTIATAIRKWLGAELAISYIHAGKPPTTWVTFLPGILIPLARTLLPGQRSVNVEIKAEEHAGNAAEAKYPLIFVFRKVMLAYDRRALLRKAFQASRNGKLILSDRYPSDLVGAIDGATFPDERIATEKSGLKRWLMQTERRIYDDICPPDMVLQLTVSVEKAIERNTARAKSGFQQTTDYVKARHSQKALPEFHRCKVIQLSTDNELDETLLEVKRQVWKNL